MCFLQIKSNAPPQGLGSVSPVLFHMGLTVTLKYIRKKQSQQSHFGDNTNSAVVTFVEGVFFLMVQNALVWTVKTVLCGEAYYNYYVPMLDGVYTVVTADILVA